MNRAIAQNGLKPLVDCVFPFAEARAAFQRMESASHCRQDRHSNCRLKT